MTDIERITDMEQCFDRVFASAVNDELIWALPANTASDNYYVTETLPNDFKRGNNAQDYQVLFPIPQFAITESNGILKQNPGY